MNDGMEKGRLGMGGSGRYQWRDGKNHVTITEWENDAI